MSKQAIAQILIIPFAILSFLSFITAPISEEIMGDFNTLALISVILFPIFFLSTVTCHYITWLEKEKRKIE